ncbi:MAG: HI0074 family nucleotidyltransferase substrate-binding subunit [Rhodocyclaceae bacterium]|jgi:nucleotidyltransferase substrate binding protein (TIGR01987 family)|nr:HI0074 family nucleotidyltransferase substrate-binding subunit [Rhodocyclaceae bacterium]
MARADQRIATALQALATLDELAHQPSSDIVRDASIQRFEYTFEATWKAAQAVLLDRFGIELASPKPVVRASLENGLLTEEEARTGLAMVDYRNLTAHTYNEELANAIFAQIPGYRRLLRNWLERLAKA